MKVIFAVTVVFIYSQIQYNCCNAENFPDTENKQPVMKFPQVYTMGWIGWNKFYSDK